MMKIAISGASGFIGTSVRNKLYKENAEFLFLKRNDSTDIWRSMLFEADVVINLAGSPVIQRWNQRNKDTILTSRVNTTNRIVKLLNELPLDVPPKLLISASAIGIYPDNGEKGHTETSVDEGITFLASVVKKWEAEAHKLTHPNIRLVIPRIGVVIGKDGGLIKKTLPLFKVGLGGKIATGKQVISFIHIDDLVAAFQYFIEQEKTHGVYNLVAPTTSTNMHFTKILGSLLKRPTLFTVPSLVLEIIYGKAASIMIKGEKVVPERLINAGFSFKYPIIKKALESIVEK